MIAFGGSDDLRASARASAARGEWSAVRSLLERTTAATLDPELLLLAAEASLRLGAPEAASNQLRNGWQALARSGDSAALRRACNMLGAAAFELGELDDAHEAFARALELADADGDHLMMARATNNLGAIANLRGNRESALAHFQLAIPAYQQLAHAVGLAESCHNIAIAYRDSGDLEMADDYERRAIEYASEGGADRVGAMARAGRADLSLRRGDPRMAERAALMAAAEYRRLEDPIGEADTLRLLGEARVEAGAPAEAMKPLNAAVELATAHGAALVLAEALHARARAHLANGSLGPARADAGAAHDAYMRLGATDELATVEALLRSIGV